MRKILVFGNSGSGKSTFAKALCDSAGFAHLDLDVLAWVPTNPPRRAPIEDSRTAIQNFMSAHSDWIIEGCYSDLLEIANADATEAVFMDLSVDQCVENARARPWEPHKYASKREQDANLDRLINWIRDYPERDDVFSHRSHSRIFDAFIGTKTRFTSNVRSV